MKYLGPPQSGSLANQTFSRNRGGQYARARNGRGGTGDSWFGSFASAWSGLTDGQRKAWNEFALGRPSPDHRLGGTITLTGFDWFCRQNGVIGAVSGHFIQTDPIVPDASMAWSECVLVSAAWSGGDLSVVVDAPAGSSGAFVLQSSGVVTAGTMSGPGRGKWWKQFQSNDWGTSQTFPWTVPGLGAWSSVFGPPSSGDWLFVRLRAVTQDFRYAGPQTLRLQVP